MTILSCESKENPNQEKESLKVQAMKGLDFYLAALVAQGLNDIDKEKIRLSYVAQIQGVSARRLESLANRFWDQATKPISSLQTLLLKS
jgi:hypothetical protein